MKQLWSAFTGLAIMGTPTIALAEGVNGYSRGNAILYFFVISVVLIFGIHDTFHKKWLTWASAIVIPIVMYLNLPAQ
jgi:hypothetical protein